MKRKLNLYLKSTTKLHEQIFPVLMLQTIKKYGKTSRKRKYHASALHQYYKQQQKN